MMSALPLAKVGRLLGRDDYLDEATYQFLVHIQYLMDPVSGLWYHGWQFNETGGHRFAGAFWARGNCWITLAIPLFLETVDVKPPVRRLLVSTLKRQIDALIRLQDSESGMWHTLLDDASSYVETSATAGFAAGLLAALRMVSRSTKGCIQGLTTCGRDSSPARITRRPRFAPCRRSSLALIRSRAKYLASHLARPWDRRWNSTSRFRSRRCHTGRLWR